jgi:hypothetical protein
MVAGVLDICGAYGGLTSGATKHNAKGMYENIAIKNLIDKPYLTSIGADPKGQFPLPDVSKLPIPNNWKDRVHTLISNEGYVGGPWYYKGPRNSLVWPVWNYAFPNAKWVIVRRRTADIAQSCLNTGFMDRYDTYEEWVTWVNHQEDRFVEMIQAGLNVKQVWPERMIKGNYEQLYELVEWLGLEWKPKEVMEFIEPKLWKSKVKQNIVKR